ncbi:MAG: GNAT family N-acetyltransferase [Inquilinus sp.]|nr:GNAT family N-acetyltransferase [Inquilinus sp.]
MACTIEWNTLSTAGWQERAGRIRRFPLLQDLAYARAMRASRQLSARWGLIRIDGAEAGLAQMLEARLFGEAIHLLTLDRGPVWFEGYGGLDHWRAFAAAFAERFPRRIGRRRRFLPELEDTPAARDLLVAAGFHRQAGVPGYQTLWLDLTPGLDALRAGLKQKWRNTLNRAERHDLAVQNDEGRGILPWVLARYAADRKARGYPGPAPGFLRALGGAFAPEGRLLILTAAKDRPVVAAVVLVLHGTAATYQIGWSSEQGRRLGAPSLLLWRAVEGLKARGIRDFDLGGVNDRDAAGVKAFKAGLGGREVRLVGQYG